jgi:tRNA(adenine34) deaminase
MSRMQELDQTSKEDEVPVFAAVISLEGQIIAEGYNSREQSNDPTGHAEIMAIRKAAKLLGDWRLDRFSLYSSLEPCLMCSAVIREARLSKVFFAIPADSVAGEHYDILRDTRLPGSPPEVVRVTDKFAEQGREELRTFFAQMRQKNRS